MKPMKKSELRALIREQVKTILKEAVSQEAHIIHTITQCGQDAAQNFIDDNKLDGKKLAAYVKQHSNAKEKYDVRDLIANTGKGAIKGFRERFLKLFKESVIKEDILNAPGQKQWDSKFKINYDDLPANLDLRTASLNKLFQGIPYQHVAYPTLSDDGNFLFKNAQDLAKAKLALGMNEAVIKENEHLDLSTWKIGDNVEFSNGEIWKVAKPGYKKANDSIFLAPFNAIAKKGHISLPIEFTADELTNTVTESINEAASDISYINKSRAKSSLDQIKKGKRADGMGKFDAKVYAIKGTQEIELKTPEDLAKYSVGYKYGLKNESVLKEADMTRFYDGFIVLNDTNRKTYKFHYVKGRKNQDVENEAIAKLMKATGEPRARFGVHGFVKKGQWNMDKTPIFTESVLKEALIGPFAISASTPVDELQAMYHGALDGYSNYKTGMKFKKSEYKLAYQTIEKILQKKGVAITEASITEAKEYSFTFDYNTDPDDIEYIENLLKKARVNAYAEQGTFDDEMVVIAGDAIELRKAKKAIEADGFQINEADDPEAGEAAPYGSGYAEVNEDAGMVVDVAMGVAVGLMGLWALVQGAPAVQRIFGDAADYLADKAEKKAKAALKNQRKETIAPIIAKFKNDKQLADMYQNLTPYSAAAKLGSSQAGLKAQQGRVNQLTKIGKYIKSKLTPEEMAYFRDISAMLRDGDIKESVIKEEITLNSPSFKKLVAKVQEISDKSGNDWDELKKYLKSKYAFFETYTTGTNPAAYVVNFFAITLGKDEDVKKSPKEYVQVGEWYIRPW
jgi:hypothetical protein